MLTDVRRLLLLPLVLSGMTSCLALSLCVGSFLRRQLSLLLWGPLQLIRLLPLYLLALDFLPGFIVGDGDILLLWPRLLVAVGTVVGRGC